MSDARQLFREGKRVEALEAARRDYSPADEGSGLLLGLICASLGETEEAAKHLEAALKSGEGQAQHWRVLAAVRGARGNLVGEAEAVREAVRLAPEDPALQLQLATAWYEAARPDEALPAIVKALRMQDSIEARRIFVSVLGTAKADTPEVREIAKRAVAEGWARHQAMFAPALRLIRARGLPLEEDDLLAALLVSGPIAEPELERELTVLRRRFLLEGVGSPEFMRRLGRQCYLNEYCWPVTGEEEAALARLPADDPRRALYQDLTEEPPAPDIPVLTPIRKGLSEAVQAMYEENPYPRWVRMPAQESRPFEWVLRNTLHRVRLDPIPGTAFLVAGCGTGQHAIQQVMRYSDVDVLAVDLSRASLTYAMRKAAEYGAERLTFGQADLLEIGSLGRKFDVISCAGTLQAMADPMEGLRALLAVLNPGGVIHLGLYSRRARAELGPAQELAKSFVPSLQGIRDLRRAIMKAPAGDPARHALGWSDFYSTSMCRDLLMHVMEHQSDIADIRQMTEGQGLRLLGFVAPAEVMAAYLKRYPDDPAAVNLDHWDEFEARNPRIFRGMYQFWAQKPAS